MQPLDCVVIGAGPAGLTAALYLKRFRRSVAVIQSGRPRAAWIPKTKNLIGYHRGISGVALLRRLHKQVAALGIPIEAGEAVVSRHRDVFEITFGGRRIHARKVILATGIRDIQPQLPNLDLLRKKGLLRYCPICDGFEHCGKRIFLFVGKEDSLDKICFLRKYSPHLIVIGPPDFLLSAQRKHAYRQLKVIYLGAKIKSVEPRRSGIRVKIDKGPAFTGDAAYVELGFHVNDAAVAGLKKLRRTQKGCFVTNKSQRTSVPGLFAVGDCTPGLAQIAVGAGQAAVAATAVHNELLEMQRPGKRIRKSRRSE